MSFEGRSFRRLAAFAALFGAFALSAEASEDVLSIPGGPRFVLLPDRSVPMVSCTVIVPAGSAFETPATNGAAHYLEHLLFNGTTSRTREDIYARADFLGAYNNASTQRERTVFQLLLPSENWRAGVELQADQILNSTLPREMFEKERGIILEELAKDRTNAEYDAERVVDEALWGSDARALPVLGTEASITGMNWDALGDFYRARYRAEAMTVVLMGDFDRAEGERALRELYDASKKRPGSTTAGKAAAMSTQRAFPPGRTLLTKRVDGVETTRVRVLLPLPGIETSVAAAGQLLADVLDGGEIGSVARGLEAKCGAPLFAAASFEGGTPLSLLSIAVDLSADAKGGELPGSAVPAAGALLEHLARLATSGDWFADVSRARVARAVDEIRLREKMHYFGLQRAEFFDAVDPGLALEWPDNISKATAEEARGLLIAAFESPLLVVATGAALDEEHAAISPEWLAERLAAAKATADAGDAEATAGMSAAKTAANGDGAIDGDALGARPAATRRSETRRLVREDGLVLLVHSTPEPRTLAIHAILRDRDRLEREGGVPFGTTDVLHRMMEWGTASRTKDEFRGTLSEIGAALKVTDADGIPYDDYMFSPEYSYVRLETIDVFAEPAVSLFAELLLHPRFDDDTFAAAKTAAVQRAKRDLESPSANADRLFYTALDSHHPRSRAVDGDPSALVALTLEAARRHHAAIVASPNIILAVSSSLPVARIQSLVNAAFPLGPPAAPSVIANAPADAPPTLSPGRRETLVETGREQSSIVIGAPVDAPDEDASALRVACSILSERLADRLREREGLAYSIGASLRIDPPGRAVTMSAGTRPENLPRIEAGMREVAAELRSTPPTREMIDGALNRAEGQTRMRRLTRIGQAYALAMAELRGRDPEKLDADAPALRAVTPEDVQRVAARRFTFDPSIAAIAR